MALLPQTEEVIAEVERLSGRKVVVQEDPSLKTLATVQTARGASPFHFLRYRASGETTNYLIVYQLGFLVRMFSCPEGERWEVGASSDEKGRGIQGLGLSEVPADYAPTLIGNLITQLRTYSVGMRVDEWILREFPALRSEQKESIKMQLRQNEQSLAPEIRDRFPKGIVNANSGMNAAYAKFWASHFSEPRYALPFSSLGYDAVAKELLAVFDNVPDDPKQDRQLIQNWADALGLTDYFHFVTHQFDD